MLYTEDQKMIRDLVREIGEGVMKPNAESVDHEARFPRESIDILTETGLMGLNIPEEYDGAGMDETCKAIAVAEITRCCANTAEIFGVQMLVNDIICRFGNEEQKQKYLPMAAAGKLGCFALTEPSAGSDASAVRTRAVKDGSDYIINGSKCFISNFGKEEGDFLVLIASTDPSKGTKGLTAFLLDRSLPGLSCGKEEDKMGMRGAAVSEVVLQDVRVPETAIIGGLGNGFKIAMIGLDGGRVSIAAQGWGIAQAALEEAVKYANQREQFGRPISANQGLQWYLADMATRIEASKQLVLHAAEVRKKGLPCSKECAMAKNYATDTAGYVVDLALQIHGGYGYMKDYPIERMYRDCRIMRLYEGTNEIQKMVISRSVISEKY